MGCLIEFILQLFIEGTVGLFMSVYLKLSSSLIPNSLQSQKIKTKIKNTITTISAFEVLFLFLGIFFLLPDDPTFNIIGKFMTFIPLSIITLQLIIGITFTILKNKSKQLFVLERLFFHFLLTPPQIYAIINSSTKMRYHQ